MTHHSWSQIVTLMASALYSSLIASPQIAKASESFDVGTDLGSPVSCDYFERRPFKFNRKIK